ncbi:MAG: hypothetical protein HY096_00275 [Nitrospinae bacterium]|nr:hypothetical protein [Nitrospinota bacterium]
MRIKNGIVIRTNFKGILIGSDGKIKKVVKASNLVVDTGLAHIIDQLYTTPAQAAMSHYAIGTDSTVVVSGNTILETEIFRKALDSKSKSGAVLIYYGAFGPGEGTGNLREGGIFNAASGGVMLARVVFALVAKTSSDTFVINHTITASAP